MIDPKIFAELQNYGIITNVGLEASDFKNLDELKNYGLATSMGTDAVYDKVLNKINVVEGVSTEDELKKLVATGGKTKLTADITLTDYIEVRSDVTIDLNGHKITHPLNSKSKYPDVFEVYSSGKLTILGDGEVNAENGYAVYAAGDSIVILDGGTYLSPVSAVDARKNANVTINGGTFKVDGSKNAEGDFGQKFTLNLRDKTGNYVSDKSIITVKGGKFYKFNPAESESEPEITNFVAEGYKSVKNGDWFVVKKA